MIENTLKAGVLAVASLTSTTAFAEVVTPSEAAIASCVLKNMAVNTDRVVGVEEQTHAWDNSAYGVKVESAAKLLFGNQGGADAEIVTIRELDGEHAGQVYVGISAREGHSNTGDIAYVLVGPTGLTNFEGGSVDGLQSSLSQGDYGTALKGMFDQRADEIVAERVGQYARGCLEF